MKRFFTWAGFIIVLGLIIWGLVAAQKKALTRPATPQVSFPAEVTSADWITGSSTAAVTLVEYGDFQCPACGAYYPVIKQLLADYGSHFRFVPRHFPLPQHLNAIPAALAAEAAGKQGKFWQMYDMLYEHQQDWSEVANPTSIFASYAETIGVLASQYQTDLKDPALAQKINSQLDLGKKAGIFQTPSFFLNGRYIENLRTIQDFEKAIDAASQGDASQNAGK